LSRNIIQDTVQYIIESSYFLSKLFADVGAGGHMHAQFSQREKVTASRHMVVFVCITQALIPVLVHYVPVFFMATVLCVHVYFCVSFIILILCAGEELTGDQLYFLSYQFLLRMVLSRCSDRSAV